LIEETIAEVREERLTESDRKFSLNATQFSSLGDLISRFGGDIEDLAESKITERGAPEYLTMPSADIQKLGNIVAVDQAVLTNIEEFIKVGLSAKDWYTEINKKILDTFGDSDGTLFLMLLAIFAAQTSLQTNFRLASQVYVGIKKDLEDPVKKEEWLQFIADPKAHHSMKNENKYQTLLTVKGLISGARFTGAYLGNLQRTLRMYRDNGFRFNRQQVVNELANHLKKSGELGKNTVISAEKIFSFTLNLLDPSYQFEWGWMPATIDTWMASFFYPYMGKKEKSKFLAKSKNYAYMARLTGEQAAKYGMKPHELQAVLWVAMIKKVKGENYNTTFSNAIEKNLERLKVEKQEISNISKFLDLVVARVGAM
jgi:hypothetical protein